MKKILLSLFTFVVALTSAFADEAKFDFTAPQTLTPAVTPSTEASTGVNVVGMTFTNKNVSVAFSGEDEKAKIFTGSEAKGFPIELRIYKNATMTITAPQGKNITSIEFNGYTIKFNADKGTLEKKAWTGSTNSVVFTPTETSKVNTIVVTYGEGGGDVVDPTPNPVDPTPSQGTGNGSLENPFDAVAANNLAASLEKGKMTETDYYIKGKVSEVREAYNTAFGNGSFCISVDGTTEGQFLVWRALYLKNEKYADGKEEHLQTKGLVNSKHFMDFVAGKAYNFVLNIPLDPIQVDAEVEEWPSTTKKTRAAEEEEGTNTGISEFINGSKLGLFAFYDSTTVSKLFMSKLNNTKVGEELTRVRNKTWNYSPKRFWPQTGILHFYAGYPYFMEFNEFNEKGKVRFTTPDYNPFGVDFLWGLCNNVKCSSHPNPVKIKMKHALARVNIYFEDYGDVDSVKVAANREGTFTSTSPEDIPIWDVVHSKDDKLIVVKKKIKDPAAILFVFPGKIKRLRFRSSLKGTIDLPNFGTDTPENFKAGKEYNICVSPSGINYDYVPPK